MLIITVTPSKDKPKNANKNATEKASKDNMIENICQKTNSISGIFFDIFKIFLVIFVICIVYQSTFSYNKETIIVRSSDNNIGSDINGAALADRLRFELQRIKEINEQEIKFSGLTSVNESIKSPKNSGFLPSSNEYPYLSTISIPAYLSSEKEILRDPGSVSMAGISLNPAHALSFLRDIFGTSEPSLTIELQRFGPTLSILATLHKSDRIETWKVSRSVPPKNGSTEDLIPVMLEDIAFEISNSLIEKENAKQEYPQTWQAFKNMTAARAAYLNYNSTGDIGDLNRACLNTICAIRSEPGYSESTRLLYGLGNIYLTKNDYQNASWLFENISDIKAAESALGLGLVYASETNHSKDALNKFEEAIEHNPQYAEAWCNKGLALSELGLKDEAIQAFDTSILLNPRYMPAMINKGIVLTDQGNYPAAIQVFNKAIDLNQNYAAAWYNKGVALRAWNKSDEAMQVWEKTTELEPSYEAAWYYKSEVFFDQGKYDETIQVCDKIISLDQKVWKPWYYKGLALSKLGKYNEALQVYDFVICMLNNTENQNISLAAVWNGKGEALLSLCMYDDAIVAFNASTKSLPSYASPWYGKGCALNALGRTTEADTAYAEARRLGMNNV